MIIITFKIWQIDQKLAIVILQFEKLLLRFFLDNSKILCYPQAYARTRTRARAGGRRKALGWGENSVGLYYNTTGARKIEHILVVYKPYKALPEFFGFVNIIFVIKILINF